MEAVVSRYDRFTCASCGSQIFIGDEYYHEKEHDENFHLSCALNYDIREFPLEQRYRED